jgi:hypothetical protein
MQAQRRCALALHSVSEVDRLWLIARLPASLVRQMNLMLDELRVLGIPGDSNLVRQTLLAPSEQRRVQTVRSSPVIPARQLGLLVVGEPAVLIACALVDRSAADRETALAEIPFGQRAAVRDVLRRLDTHVPPFAPALMEAIKQELAKKTVQLPRGTSHRAIDRIRAGASRIAGVFA